MVKLNSLRQLLIYAGHKSIIIALAAAGIAYTTAIFQGFSEPNWLMLICVYFMMYSVYRTNKILDLEEDQINNPERVKLIHHTSNKKILLLKPIAAFLLSLAIAFFNSLEVFAIIVFAIFWIVGYSLEFPKFAAGIIGYRKIKQIPYVKTIYSSVAWGLIAFIATFFLHLSPNMVTYAVFVLVFLRFSINAIVFDMRDVSGDKKIGIMTIPVIYGLRKTRKILHAMNFLAVAFVFFGIWMNWLPYAALILNFISIYAAYFIKETANPRAHMGFLCDVIVDGEFVIWPILALIGFCFL